MSYNAIAHFVSQSRPLEHKTKQGLRYTINETARRKVLDRLLHLNH